MHAVLSLCCLLAQASGLQLGQLRPTCTSVRAAGPIAGLFDMFQETEEQRLAKEREKEEQYKAMQAMQQRRRDPVANDLEISKRRNLETATRAAQQGNLPDNWAAAVDAQSGETYYWNKETNVTQWEPPLDEMVAILEERQRQEMESLVEEVTGTKK